MLTERPIGAEAPQLSAALTEAQLPTDDLAEPGRTFFAFLDAGEPVGFGGFELCGEHALLRSVVVLPERRGRGYGRALAARVLEHAREAGAIDAYLLTTTAESFFERAGFSRIDRSSAPAEILETRQAASICATAALLFRSLAPTQGAA